MRVIEYSNQVGANAINQFNNNPDYKPAMVLGDQQQNNPYNNETKEKMLLAQNLQVELDTKLNNFTKLIEKLCIVYGIQIQNFELEKK